MQIGHEYVELPWQVESVPAGRHFLQHTLGVWGLGVLADTVALAASEVLTNVVLHARTSLRLDIDLSDRLVVSVRDLSAGALPDQASAATAFADLDAEGGRGLALVGVLCQDWGVRQTPPGKTVWFSVALP